MTRTRALGAALLGTALTTSLTACGASEADEFADQSVASIQAQVEKDMGSVESLTMDGSFTQNGEKTTLKLSADTDGNCVGTLGTAGGSAKVLSLDDASYIKADEEFWTAQAGPQGAQIASVLGDKWAKLPAGAGGFDQFCDLDNFLDELTSDDDAKVTKGSLKAIDGQQALELTSSDSEGRSTGWVSAEGKHYFLRLEKKGSDGGSFTFSDFNEPVEADKPADEDVLDMSSMG
jgi:hypothetical protein